MTKDQLVEAIAEKTGTSKAVAGEMVNAFIETVTATLSKGDSVTLTGFGSFLVSHRAARKGRNPQTGAELQIPEMDVPRFKAGKALKDAVR